MVHLIDKSVLVAEIENRIKETESMQPKFDQFWAGQISAFKGVLKIIDTLEVKEVDFGIEICRYIGEYFNVYDDDNQTLQTKDKKSLVGRYDAEKIAKHFFELGLRSTITEEDCKLIWNIGDEIPNMPEEEFFKELLKRYKTQKGK